MIVPRLKRSRRSSRRRPEGFLALLTGGLAVLACGSAWSAERPTQTAETSRSFRYDAKGHRDPFVPLVRDGRIVDVGGLTDRSHMVLYGILWDPGGESIALINDSEAKVGDAVGKYQVKDIRQDAVVLSDGGEPVVLQLTFEASPSKRSPATTQGR